MTCPVCHTRLYPVGSFTPQVIGLRVVVEAKPTDVSDKVLTVRERARILRVREDMANGVNPYTKLQTMVIGGKAPRADVNEPGFTPPMDKTLWKPGGKTYQAGAPIWNALAIPLTPTSGERCTFCNVPVDERTLTRGHGKSRIITKLEQRVVGERVEIIERVLSIPEKVVACPDCVLRIKPIYARCQFCKESKDMHCNFCNGTRVGEKVSNGIKFRETPG